jgi:transcriptional regulator with XRE-family HTH domain
MSMEHQMSDRELLTELGQRLRDARLERNLSQEELAERAGIGRITLQRMEAGRSPSLVNFVGVLRALDLLGGLERLLPAPAPSPIDQLERRGRRRQRAGSPRTGGGERRAGRWRWGDESPGGNA